VWVTGGSGCRLQPGEPTHAQLTITPREIFSSTVPTVMARLWMSGSVTPLVTTSHVLPPSLAVPHAVYFEAGPDVLVVDRVDH
jgi:hypothetical protein